MKFIIERTSDYWKSNKPCEESHKEEINWTEECTYNTVEEYDEFMKSYGWVVKAKSWKERGTDHRTENGKPVRTMTAEKWVVEFSTIEDLMKFINKYDRVVINSCEDASSDPYSTPEPYPTIEIYDTWRE